MNLSKLIINYQYVGLEVTEKGVFTWEDFESSAIQFDLFIRSIKNLISR
jgi:hypothetical protein